MNDSYSRQVAVFKAFCDENRWKILDLLTSGEKCACVLLNKLEISQSTLSHHMKILCDSGIVIGRKMDPLFSLLSGSPSRCGPVTAACLPSSWLCPLYLYPIITTR